MEKRSYSTRLFIALSIVSLFSCQKKDYDNSFATFGNAFFINQTTVSNPDFGVKYEGDPISWALTGQVEVPEGEGTFTFYNTRTGAVLGEKRVAVSKANPPRYILFQPIDGLPVSFLDPNAQANEEAAPANYMKIKIANMSQAAFPDQKIDVVFQSTVTSATRFGPVDTIEGVGRDLGEVAYVLVKRAVRANAIQTRYKLSFLDAATKQPVLASGGAAFLTGVEFNTGSNPAPKGVYTLYLTDYDRTSNAVYLKRGEKYYDISTNVLFKD